MEEVKLFLILFDVIDSRLVVSWTANLVNEPKIKQLVQQFVDLFGLILFLLLVGIQKLLCLLNPLNIHFYIICLIQIIGTTFIPARINLLTPCFKHSSSSVDATPIGFPSFAFLFYFYAIIDLPNF